LTYIRLFSDPAGVSRFADEDILMVPSDFSPPAPALDASDPIPASIFMMIRLPEGWSAGVHPAPARQFMIVTEGQIEVVAGGEHRVLKPGDVLLAEDTDGAGHATTVIEETVFAVVRI
jgi:hypothetical protein